MLNQRLQTAAVGTDRAEHSANIQNNLYARRKYAELHHDMFLEKDKRKYVVCNDKGLITNSANDPKMLGNATVRHEDFLTIQDKIVEVRRRTLNGITDLISAGLSFPVSISDQLVGFENINEFQEARQDMNPTDYQNNDTKFVEEFVPNPITHQSFSVPWRQDSFDYKRSLGLGETMRQVSEKLENTLFNGNAAISVAFNGANTIYGYTTHPDRGTDTISNWSLVANIALIFPEAVEQVGLLWSTQGGVGENSVVMYVGNAIWTNLQNDYKADSEKSVLEKLRGITQIRDVRPAEKLLGTSVVLVEMMERTVQLAVASDLIAVPHIKVNPMAPQVLTTYAAMVQQIKSDVNGNTGIRHLSI